MPITRVSWKKQSNWVARFSNCACLWVGPSLASTALASKKINQMCSQFTDAELKQFHAIKQALDPAGILNPGKAIPTLHRCAELGAMHVHQGQLPHPELERF